MAMLELYYKNRFFNFENIKKYETYDIESLNAISKLLDSKYDMLLGNIIKQNNVYFGISKSEGYCQFYEDNSGNNHLIKVMAKIDNGSTSLFHELGHAADINISKNGYNYFSSSVTINNTNQTLLAILNNEVSVNKASILNHIVNELKTLIDNELGEGTSELQIKYSTLFKDYKKYSRKVGGLVGFIIPTKKSNKPGYEKDLAKYRELHDQIIENDVVIRDNLIKSSNAHKYIVNKYNTILDTLSAFDNLDYPFNLTMHTKAYYDKDNTFLVKEFFANMFSLVVTNSIDKLDIIKQLLPNSYDAFMWLFDYLVNNIYNI